MNQRPSIILQQSMQLTTNIQQLPFSMPTCIQQPYNMPTHNVFAVNSGIQSNIIQQVDTRPEYIQQNAIPTRLYKDNWKSSPSIKISTTNLLEVGDVQCVASDNNYDSQVTETDRVDNSEDSYSNK
ncbi:11716_t:CDS:2, partial [Gigaspora margarita]